MPQSEPENPIPPPRVLVIGLDGATFKIIDPLIEQGRLPVIGKLIQEGTRTVLASTIPPVTIPAWISMLTGKNPGRLGVFDLLKRVGYRSEPNDVCYDDESPLWHILNKYGVSTGLLNIPGTYPPQKVNGFMVTGMLTPSKHSSFTYPSDLSHTLDQEVNDYELDITQWQYFDEGHFVKDIYKLTNKRRQAITYLKESIPCEFYMTVFTSSDRIQHVLWNQTQIIEEYWENLDRELGQLLTKFSDDTNIFIVSDHGFGPLRKTFFVNKWLRQHKYLRVKGLPKDSILGRIGKGFEWFYRGVRNVLGKIPGITWFINGLLHLIGFDNLRKITYEYLSKEKLEGRVAWRKTKAFGGIHSPHFGQIYLNRRGKMKRGIVKKDDVENNIKEIIEKLKQLKNPDTGEALKVEVFRPEDVYHGEYVDEAPDIIFMLDDGTIEIDATVEDGDIFEDGSSFTGWTGTHTRDGVLIANGPLIKQGHIIPEANIMDITPTILHVYGVPITGDIDGKIIYDLFSDSARFNERSVITGPLSDEGDVKTLSNEEKALIEERLRKLGYLS